MTRHITNYTEQRLLEAIQARTGTASELAARIHGGHRNVKGLLNQLHARGWIHVHAWRRGTSGPISPVYGFGHRPDYPKPAPLETSVICRRYRARLREKFGENYGVIHEAQKHRVPGRKIIVSGEVVYQQ